MKVQIAKKNESYAKQANQKRKEVVLEPGDDPEHLRTNVFQEGGNDENPKTTQIHGSMTRSRTKQTVDTLQQMVADSLNKAQVEKDEGPKVEALLRILIAAKGPNCFKGPCLFLSFHSNTLYVWILFSIEEFWHLIKFGESVSLDSLLNQSQTYQGNSCGVYLDLSSLSRSGVIQNSVTCIKQSHNLWTQVWVSPC